MTRILLFVLLAACAGLAGCRSAAPTAAALIADRDPEVPSSYEAGRVYVYASVNNRPPARFLFDTGASVNAITPDAARRFGLTDAPSVPVTDSNEHARTLPGATARTVELGPAALTNLRFVITEDAGDERDGVDGILGLDGLAAFTVDIDYPARRVRITADRVRPDQPGVTPFRPLDGPTVAVPVRIDTRPDAPVWALLDTGGATTLRLDPAASRLHTLAHAARPVDFTRGLHGTARVIAAAPLSGRLVIGDTALPPVAVVIDEPRNLLGFHLLRNFRVRIDGPSRLVAFTPAALVSPDAARMAASPAPPTPDARFLP